MASPHTHDGAAILRRIVTYAPGSFVPAVLTLVTSMVFTRIFDPTDFGLYSLVLVVANTCKVVLTMWLIQAVGKFVPAEKSEVGRETLGNAIFVSTAAVLVVECVVGAALLLVGERIFPLSTGDFLMPAIAFVLIGSVFDILGSVFPAEHRAKESVTFRLIDSVATFCLRLVMVSSLIGLGISSMLWSVCLSNAVLVPIMWVKAGLPGLSKLYGMISDSGIRQFVGRFVMYGLPMALWYFAGLLLDVADRFVIAYFEGPAAAGIYDANYRLITGGVALMIVPITATLAPVIMAISGSGRIEAASQALERIIENLLVLGVLAVGITSVVYPYLSLLLGPEFRQGSVIMPIVLAGVFAFNIGTFAHKPFEMSGRTRPMLLMILVATVVNLGLNVALVPVVGYIGAAYATLVAYCLYTVGVSAMGRRIVPWSLKSKEVFKDIAMISVACVGISVSRSELEYRAGVAGSVLTVVACALLGLWSVHRVTRRISGTDAAGLDAS